MGLKDDSLKVKKVLDKIVGNIVDNKTKACLRLYKAKVISAPTGQTCGVELVGDNKTFNLPYSSMVNNLQVNDLVWVATIYNSFSNAIIFAPIDFNFNNALINSIYPVGSIYLSINNVSPASFIGGTWEQISNFDNFTGYTWQRVE